MSDYDSTPTSRFEEVMRAIIDGTEYTKEPRSVMEALLIELNDLIKGGGGGGVTVVANPSGEPTDELLKIQIGSTIYSLNVDTSNFVTKDEIGAPGGVAQLDENADLPLDDMGVDELTPGEIDDMWND